GTDTGEVRCERVGIEEVALVALARWIADHAGRAADHDDRLVPRELEAFEQYRRHQVADVETRRRRIVAGIHRHDLRREELRETCWIGAVSVQSTLLELVEDQHVATLARASGAASARTRVSSSRGSVSRGAASSRTRGSSSRVT